MTLKQSYLSNRNDRVAHYRREIEQKPGKYRVEWISSNGSQGHGNWITYLEAKAWIDRMKIDKPYMTHTIRQMVEEQEPMNLD